MAKQVGVFRSRRKRRFRCVLSPYASPSTAKSSSSLKQREKDEWQYEEYHHHQQEKPKRCQEEPSSILSFLARRERTSGRRGSGSFFRTSLMQQPGHTPPATAARGRRVVAFSRLGTTPTQAVVGLEGTGSYFLSLEGNDDENSIYLHIHAVPSPASLACCEGEQPTLLLRRRRQWRPVSPRIQTIAIPIHNAPPLQISSVLTNCRLDIVWSSDFRMGAAFVVSQETPTQSQSSLSSSSPLGNLFLFDILESPTTTNHATTRTPKTTVGPTHCCSNVPIRPQTTMRKLLWMVQSIPLFRAEPIARHCPRAYLLLNDEDDGYRLTWVSSLAWGETWIPPSTTTATTTADTSDNNNNNTTRGTIPRRNDIVAAVKDWDRMGKTDDHERGVSVQAEAYLRVDALLDDIRSRRPDTFCYPQHTTDFAYDLVSVHDLWLTLVIAFTTPTKTLCAVIQIDVLTQRYRELEWVGQPLKHKHQQQRRQHQHQQQPGGQYQQDLSRSSRILATNRRLASERLGPFSVCTDASNQRIRNTDWSLFLSEDYASGGRRKDKKDTPAAARWRSYLQHKKLGLPTKSCLRHKLVSIPPLIPYGALYPDCDAVSNKAIRTLQPVDFISCRNQSVELIYG